MSSGMATAEVGGEVDGYIPAIDFHFPARGATAFGLVEGVVGENVGRRQHGHAA